MNRLLVTGGAGFVGNNFIRLLLQTRPRCEVINLDKLTYAGTLGSMRDFQDNPHYRFVKGDVADQETVNRLVSDNVDTIVHFAAESHVDKSIVEPAEFVDTNVKGTFVLLEAARKYGVTTFVHTSTPEVYGAAQSGQRFREDSPISPNNPYSASKAAADCLCRAYFHTYGVPITYIRFNNVYGRYQYPEKLMPVAITRALQNKPIPLFGDGSDKRNWIHVIKVCETILLVAERGKPGQAYNIGSEYERTNLQLVTWILEMMGKPRSLIQFFPNRPGHDYQYPLDSTRIVSKLGWDPSFDLEGTVRDTIRWYDENRWWWQDLPTRDYGSMYRTMQPVL